MKVPEEYRISISESAKLGSSFEYGNNGAFRIPHKGVLIFCIASDKDGWEHVSASIVIPPKGEKKSQSRIPTWKEMCVVKDFFWDEEDCVMQLHPPKKDYVNNFEYALHLWRPIGKEILQPPKYMV